MSIVNRLTETRIQSAGYIIDVDQFPPSVARGIWQEQNLVGAILPNRKIAVIYPNTNGCWDYERWKEVLKFLNYLESEKMPYEEIPDRQHTITGLKRKVESIKEKQNQEVK